MKKRFQQVIALNFPAANTVANVDTTTLKDYSKVIGLRMVFLDASSIAHVGTSLDEELKIGGETIKPRGYALEGLTCGINTPPAGRFFPIDVEVKGELTTVTAKIKDGGNAGAYPLKAHLILLVEKDA